MLNIDLLSSIVLKLGQIDRITKDVDGNKESVTTHSLMLALVARSIIEDCYCGNCCSLSNYRVLEYCAVHDLHEWKYGDFQSYRLDKDLEIQKINLDNTAYNDLRELFSGTWLSKSLFNYHSQRDKESRFVRALDKCLPKLTHKQNGAMVLTEMGSNKEEFWRNIEVKQRESIISYAGEFTCVINLHRKLSGEVTALLPD